MIACLLLAAIEVTAEVKVDRRVELMSIIFRLAGSPEYNHLSSRSPYSRDVEKHFRKDHAVIEMARELRKRRGIAFDAVMSLAVHCNEKLEYTHDGRVERLDHRWRIDEMRKFLVLARNYRVGSKFDEFFTAHKPLYDAAVASHRAAAEKNAHIEWFDRFFGKKPEAKYVIILALLNGPMNYGVGVRVNGKETLTPVLGMYRFDDKGIPQPVPRFVALLIHEICHSYVNPIVDRHAAKLEPAAKPLYRVKAKQMREQAYSNWKIMMYESIVRACVLEHMRAHDLDPRQQTFDDYRIGFTWSTALATLLRKYQAERERFRTFDEFIPLVAAFFERERKKLPPAPVLKDFQINEKMGFLRFTFDQPMRDKSWSMILDGNEPFPRIEGKIRYDRERKVLTVPVALEAGTEYSFWLNSEERFGFISERGVPLAPRRIRFRTK
ncbi:MAG: DUF4932 domain-containing protein [Planctomycetota bacterium]